MPHGEALDVDLVDDRIREVAPQRSVGSPVEGRVRDQAERHVPGGVERAGRVVVVPGVVEHRGAERHLAAHRPRVRVEQQLGRVAAQPPGRVVRPVHAEPVGLPRAGPGDDPVPGAAVVVRQPVPGLGPGVVEKAYLGRLGHAGGHREVGPAVERRRAQGARPAGKCIRHSAYVTHRRYPKAPGDEARHEPCGASRADGLYPGLVPFQVWLPRGYAAAPGPARAIMAGVCVNVAFYGMWRTLALLGRAPGWLTPPALRRPALRRPGLPPAWPPAGLASRRPGLPPAWPPAGLASRRPGLPPAWPPAGPAAADLADDDLEQLRGPGRRDRCSRLGLAVGCVTLAGLPPTAGFVSEWFLLESLMQQFRVPGLGYRLALAVAGAAVALTAGFAGVTFVRQRWRC